MPEVQIGRVPFQEAIAFFQGKLDVTTERWDQMLGEAHAKAFTVAGATKLDLLQDLRGAVAKAIEDGETISQFRKRFDQVVAKHGWSYKGKRGWRTRVIYDTNLRTAHAAGRWQQIQRLKARRPYLQYKTAGDERVRPLHHSWNNTVLHVDDPWWDTHYPPNGWGCRCGVRSLSQRQLEREGLTVSKSPDIKRTERINPQTGEVYGMVPEGIDVGWDYNVGKNWLYWDKYGHLPDCADGPFDFAKDSDFVCLTKVPGQPKWKDLGRPRARDVGDEFRAPSPELLPRAESLEEALASLKSALFMSGSMKLVTTPINEQVILLEDKLIHVVEKRQDARERYGGFILSTLESPFEVWLTEYYKLEGERVRRGYFRTRYIGLFKGADKEMFLVVNRNPDGSILWTAFPKTKKDIDKMREGVLLYAKDKEME